MIDWIVNKWEALFHRKKNNNAKKLNPVQVLSIRKSFKKGEKVSALSTKYGVAGQTIRDIVKRNTWKNI